MFAKQYPLTRARPHASTAGRQRLESVLRKWVAYNSKLVTACPHNKAASFSAGGVGTPMNALWGGESSVSCYWQGVDALATVILRAVDGHVARATEMLTSLIASRFSSLFSEGPRQVLHWQLCVCCHSYHIQGVEERGSVLETDTYVSLSFRSWRLIGS